MKIKEKIQQFWWFRFRNPIIRKGEAGAFRFVFRRFWLEIETLSGNFKARFMADEHPYAYLLASQGDENIRGFCQTVYLLSKTLTSDQGLVDDVSKAFAKYDKRIQKKAASEVKEDEIEEEAALEQVKAVQEVVEMPKKERKKYERKVDRRFKKAVKEAAKNERPM